VCIYVCVCVYMCVYISVCVCVFAQREERERETHSGVPPSVQRSRGRCSDIACDAEHVEGT
jgi:hypothetical protein